MKNLCGIKSNCIDKIPSKLKYNMKYYDYWCGYPERKFQKRLKSKAIRKQGKKYIKEQIY